MSWNSRINSLAVNNYEFELTHLNECELYEFDLIQDWCECELQLSIIVQSVHNWHIVDNL